MLAKLPMLSKADVRENLHFDLLSDNHDNDLILRIATSGSTGEPFVCYADQHQLDFELDFFGRILERHPNYVDVLRVQGNNLTLKGRYAEGMQIDKRLVQLRPSDPLAHYNLALLYARLKDPARAQEEMKIIEKLKAKGVATDGVVVLPPISPPR